MLSLSTARMNRLVRRRPDLFPPDFAFPLSMAEWQHHFPYAWGGSRRRGTRIPWVYTGAGVLQVWVRSGSSESLEMLRWLAQVGPAWRFPAPKPITRLVPAWAGGGLRPPSPWLAATG